MLESNVTSDRKNHKSELTKVSELLFFKMNF